MGGGGGRLVIAGPEISILAGFLNLPTDRQQTKLERADGIPECHMLLLTIETQKKTAADASARAAEEQAACREGATSQALGGAASTHADQNEEDLLKSKGNTAEERDPPTILCLKLSHYIFVSLRRPCFLWKPWQQRKEKVWRELNPRVLDQPCHRALEYSKCQILKGKKKDCISWASAFWGGSRERTRTWKKNYCFGITNEHEEIDTPKRAHIGQLLGPAIVAVLGPIGRCPLLFVPSPFRGFISVLVHILPLSLPVSLSHVPVPFTNKSHPLQLHAHAHSLRTGEEMAQEQTMEPGYRKALAEARFAQASVSITADKQKLSSCLGAIAHRLPEDHTFSYLVDCGGAACKVRELMAEHPRLEMGVAVDVSTITWIIARSFQNPDILKCEQTRQSEKLDVGQIRQEGLIQQQSGKKRLSKVGKTI